jgi:hypothetical protein
MDLNQAAAARMPIRMPSAASIRKRIALLAAEACDSDPEYFASLLGPIEPITSAREAERAGWRLSHYHGSARENHAIERAVAEVYRAHPFIDAD